MDYTPNAKIVDRAVELWIQMLSDPKYDNGDRSENGFIARALIPRNNSAEVLARFGVELRRILLEPLDWEFESNGKKQSHRQLFRDLHVDYGPDIPLSEAAKRSGLHMEFPCKTNMWLNEDSLELRYGYGAPTEHHRPLRDGRWLVAKLAGSDMPKIVALVEAGVIGLDLAPRMNAFIKTGPPRPSAAPTL